MERKKEAKDLFNPLTKLEMIKIVSSCSENYLILVLSLAPNLKEIFLGMNTSLSDKVLTELICKTGLERLEKLTVQKCTQVSSKIS